MGALVGPKKEKLNLGLNKAWRAAGSFFNVPSEIISASSFSAFQSPLTSTDSPDAASFRSPSAESTSAKLCPEGVTMDHFSASWASLPDTVIPALAST